MSIHVDSQGRLRHPYDQHLALTCPNCQVLSHISPISVPSFDELVRFKPKQIGVVYRCDSCNAPIFLKYNVKAYTGDAVELSANYIEIERARERFNFTYLPEECEVLFREALNCYSTSSFNAFASMCRRTAQAVFQDLGETGKLRIFDQFNDIKQIADIDNETFSVLRKVVFDHDSDGTPNMPMIDAAQAGILLEVMKDLLYQSYVRKGKLQQAVQMRKFFVDEATGRFRIVNSNRA